MSPVLSLFLWWFTAFSHLFLIPQWWCESEYGRTACVCPQIAEKLTRFHACRSLLGLWMCVQLTICVHAGTRWRWWRKTNCWVSPVNSSWESPWWRSRASSCRPWRVTCVPSLVGTSWSWDGCFLFCCWQCLNCLMFSPVKNTNYMVVYLDFMWLGSTKSCLSLKWMENDLWFSKYIYIYILKTCSVP